MEGNGMGGGMLGGISSGMLGLEMPLHQHQQHQHQLVSFAAADHQQPQPHQQQPKHHPFAYNPSKGKQQQQITALSDEDDQDGDAQSGGAGKRASASPWQRMKWTDSMVRLLIMMVYYVGDDGGGVAASDAAADSSGKKKTGGGCAGGLLQKKGKWKSVSRAMMEKGFYVSPQQCEDKFNDLNKRYKRVNDIIGKGTACRVVENQSLLDSMDHISPKMKEEVRKLLNSKHLFFREMCAYHSSCGTSAAPAAATGQDSSSQQQQHLQQRCFHSTDAVGAPGMRRERSGREEEEDERGDAEEEDDEDDSNDEDDEDDEEIEEGSEHRQVDDKGQLLASLPSKRQRPSPAMQQLSMEVVGVMQDGAKSAWEQRQWLRSRVAQLEEQRVGYQFHAFELEKQRFKWLKFSGKKERELERLKLENERMRLENERMVLLLRHKDLELDLHFKRPGPDHLSSITTG